MSLLKLLSAAHDPSLPSGKFNVGGVSRAQDYQNSLNEGELKPGLITSGCEGHYSRFEGKEMSTVVPNASANEILSNKAVDSVGIGWNKEGWLKLHLWEVFGVLTARSDRVSTEVSCNEDSVYCALSLLGYGQEIGSKRKEKEMQEKRVTEAGEQSRRKRREESNKA